jgi:hypothetical protein
MRNRNQTTRFLAVGLVMMVFASCSVFMPTKILTENTLVDWRENNIPASEIQYRLKGSFELFREVDSKNVRVEGGTIKSSSGKEVESLLFVDGIKGVSLGTVTAEGIHVSFSVDDNTGLHFVPKGGNELSLEMVDGKVSYMGGKWSVKNPNGGELNAPQLMYVASSKSKIKNKTTVVRGRSL